MRLFLIVAASFCLAGPVTGQNVGFSSQVLPNRELESSPSSVGTDAKQLRTGTAQNLPKQEILTKVPKAAIMQDEWSVLTGRPYGRFGILADGAFSSALNSSSGALPTTGAIGLNFIVLRPVTYLKSYRYMADSRLGRTLSTGRDSSLHLLPNEYRLETKLSLNAYGAFGSQGDTLQVKQTGGMISNQAAFGQVLLQPGVYTRGFRSAGLSAQLYPHSWWEKFHGLRNLGYTAEGVVTVTQWSYLQQRAPVVIWAMATGVNYRVFDSPSTTSEEISGRMELYTKYSLRQITGDVRDTPIILEQSLGDVRRYWFHGLEFGSRIAINNLRLSASYFKFGDHVKGFSNGQFVLSVGFSGAIRFKDLEN